MINMGKRFLLILLSLFVFAGASFAYGTPRWFKMPVSVYVSSNDLVLLNAFKSWQNASGGVVRFLFHTSKNTEALSNISVSFVDELPEGIPYRVDRKTTIFGNTDYYSKNGYFYKAQIYIARRGGEDKKDFSASEIRAISLRAVGEVLGVNPSKDITGVMSPEIDYEKTSVTGSDVKALNSLYRP